MPTDFYFHIKNLTLAVELQYKIFDHDTEIKVPSGTVVVTHLFVKKY